MSGHNTGAVLEGKRTRRGTSNSAQRGSSEDRRRRREWLVETYRANVDASVMHALLDNWVDVQVYNPRLDGCGYAREACCRCYRCGQLLTVDTVTVDRIIPGCKGGTYRRDNIRPACGDCNSETGGPLANGREHQAAKKAARRRSIA